MDKIKQYIIKLKQYLKDNKVKYYNIDYFIKANLDELINGNYLLKDYFDENFFKELKKKYNKKTFNTYNSKEEYDAFLLYVVAQTKLLKGDSISSIILGVFYYDNLLKDLLLKLGHTKESIGKFLTDKVVYGDEEEEHIDYCSIMNETVEKFDEVIVGREKELQLLEQSLLRKNKPNVILVGDGGVGKTAIVEKFVKKINSSDKSYPFYGYKVYSLNVSDIISGSYARGMLESKITALLDELKSDSKSILFIDEIHTIMKNQNISADSDGISDILKPALARGEIKVIGATTYDEYVNTFEKDKALQRRFLKINVNEPTRDEAIKILSGAINSYEKFHDVKFTEESIIGAVDLSIKYILNKKLPDKAFDLIDSAGAYYHGQKKVITIEDIKKEISKLYNIPLDNFEEDTDKLFNNLKKDIIGQDNIIEILKNNYLISKSGLKSGEKPLFSAMINGISGSGKTYLCEKLADNLHLPLIRLDMSEYNEKHTISKLIGTPPGYIGYSDANNGGVLLSKIEKNPYSVLLLDNIDKANPVVLDIFLQIMDSGRLTGSNGKEVSFKNVIILATSTSIMSNNNGIGFNNLDKFKIDNFKFSNEFLSRFDSNIDMNILNEKELEIIIKNQLSQLQDKVKTFKLVFDKNFAKNVVKKVIEEKHNLRVIQRIIDSYLPVVSQHILSGKKENVKLVYNYVKEGN